MEAMRNSEDITGKVERVPISAAKGLRVKDLMDFVYVRCNIPGPGMSRDQFWSDFEGCTCTDSCDSTCVCISRFGRAYDDQGKLMVVDPFSNKMKPIYECNKSCTCLRSCPNRLVQRGITCKLQVFQTTTSKGLGVRTTEPVSRNAFVCEYAGEVLPLDVARTRTRSLKKGQANYILVVREHLAEGESRTNIDPSYIGNVGRFINHSCQPNLYMAPVRVDSDVPHLALFALRDLVSGEELTYDYSGVVHQAADSQQGTPTSSRVVDSNKAAPSSSDTTSTTTKCRCESANCRGVLPFDESLYGDGDD